MIVRELITVLGFRVDEARIRRAEQLVSNYSRTATASAVATNRAGFAVGTFTRRMVGLTTAGLAARGVIGELHEYERLKAMLETLTGSTAAAERQFRLLDNLARDTPFNIDQVTRGWVRLNSTGLNPTREQMLSLSNIAAGMGSDLERLVEGITGVPAGLVRQLEHVVGGNVWIDRATDRLKLTMRGITYETTRDLQSVLDLMTEIGNTSFAGASDRFMERLPGKLSNALDAVKRFVREFGEGGFTDALNEFLEAFIGSTEEGENLARVLGKLAGDILRILTAALKFATEHAVWFKTAFMGLVLAGTGSLAMRFFNNIFRFFGLVGRGGRTTLSLEGPGGGGGPGPGDGGGGVGIPPVAVAGKTMVTGATYVAIGLIIEDVLRTIYGDPDLHSVTRAVAQEDDGILGSIAQAIVNWSDYGAANFWEQGVHLNPTLGGTYSNLETTFNALKELILPPGVWTDEMARTHAQIRRPELDSSLIGRAASPMSDERFAELQARRRSGSAFPAWLSQLPAQEAALERLIRFNPQVAEIMRSGPASAGPFARVGNREFPLFDVEALKAELARLRSERMGPILGNLTVYYTGDPEANQTRREMVQEMVDTTLVPALEDMLSRVGIGGN